MNATESTTMRQEEIPYLLRIALLISYGGIIITGILGNLLTIVAILACKKHRSTQNAYVCNLAISDLLICISLAPTAVWMLKNEQYHHKEVMLTCQVIGACSLTLLLSSLYNLAGVAVNRYICIIHPPHVYIKLYSRNRICFSLFMIWFLSILLTLPGLLGFGSYGYSPLLGTCLVMNDRQTYLMVMTTYVPFCSGPCIAVITFSYTKIVLRFRHVTRRVDDARGATAIVALPEETVRVPSDPDITTTIDNGQPSLRAVQRIRKQMTVIANLCVVFGLFILCWTPLLCLYYGDSKRAAPIWLYRTIYVLAAANSSINFFVYAGMNKGFRRTYAQILTGRWKDINSH